MSGKRQTRQRNDDFLMGEASGASSSVALVPARQERLVIVPQEVSGAEGGGVPWFVWALLIAGVGYLILKQEKIL
jgi:hypothetical protein